MGYGQIAEDLLGSKVLSRAGLRHCSGPRREEHGSIGVGIDPRAGRRTRQTSPGHVWRL